jgi:hypothetical protein
VLIMVSKAGHCLNDLLYRRAAESLRIDIPLVVGNHRDLEPLATAHGVAFEYVPVDSEPMSAQRAEGRVLDLVGARTTSPRTSTRARSSSRKSPGWTTPVPRKTSRRSAVTPSVSLSPARCAGTPNTASCCTAVAPSSSSNLSRPPFPSH